MQGLAGVSGLASWFAPAVCGTLRFGSLESVAGGRLAAVGAVFSETFFEFANADFEPGDFGPVAGFLFVKQSDNHSANRIQSTLIKGHLDCRTKGLLVVIHWNVNVSEVVNLS